MKEKIRSFINLYYLKNDSPNLCLQDNFLTRCKDKICLQINSTEVNCLSIDEKIRSSQLSIAEDSYSDLTNDKQSSVDVTNTISEKTNPNKNDRYRPTNTMLFGIMFLGIFAIVSENSFE